MRAYLFISTIFAVLCGSAQVMPRERIELAAVPTVSPDGKQFGFVWHGDVWIAPVKGGNARQLTSHPAEDHWPCWSPNGKQIAFTSKRDGYWNIYIIPSTGGVPTKLTEHSEGYTPLEWYPDGTGILTKVRRDYLGFDSTRLLRVDINGSVDDEILFDAYARHGTMSPDSTKTLFIREGGNMLYRKGYRGSKSSQIWLHDSDTKDFKQICVENYGCRFPLWKPDGLGFYFVCDKNGTFNLWEKDLSTSSTNQLTFFKNDSVIMPSISRDGGTIIFRKGFDFYKYYPNSRKEPSKVNLWRRQDGLLSPSRRRWYDAAWNNDARQGIDWTDDFLEVAFTAGGDVWVMDTVLREPRLVCGETRSHETEVVFGPENDEIWFLRDFGDRTEIWKAVRKNKNKFWFENDKFTLSQFSSHKDRTNKNRLSLSPDGKTLAFCRDTGDLVITSTDKYSPRLLLGSTVFPGYDWSPDGRWLAVQSKDSEDNWDVWVVAVNGEEPPFNLSRHPKWDGSPRWSADGRLISFVGRRGRNDEFDLHYVYLIPDDEGKSERLSKLEEAKKKLLSSRTIASKPIQNKKDVDLPLPLIVKASSPKVLPRVVIDFEGLHDRVRRVVLSGSKESNPFWHRDSSKLAFTSDIGGVRGIYTIKFPNELNAPKLLTKTIGLDPYWESNEIHWLVDNIPSKTKGSVLTKYTFKAYQDTDREQYLRLGYRMIWRNLRDFFYDKKMNGKDWDELLKKYENHITASIDRDGFGRLVNLLIGELNASHLFFELNDKIWPQWKPDHGWRWETVHLGVIFDRSFEGLGLKVKTVLHDGPACKPDSMIYEDEVILSIDGLSLDSPLAERHAFNRRLNEVADLKVKDPLGNVRLVHLEPISFTKARELMKESWISDNQRIVQEESNGKLGYLHVNRMKWDDLFQFEEELFSLGYRKEGLVIDVRNNTGGFTADRMLNMLSRPLHAITIPRGGKRSYPLGYLDHFYWDKPIVVLCNQNTASNGEIFCHAIKATKRGKLIGVRTAGSVISVYTDEKFLDIGKMSIPFRGWYKLDDGRDMEGNGAVPDIEIWPQPAEIPNKIDQQLSKAVEVLLKDCLDFNNVNSVDLKSFFPKKNKLNIGN